MSAFFLGSLNSADSVDWLSTDDVNWLDTSYVNSPDGANSVGWLGILCFGSFSSLDSRS